ncbi:unnamed protein product [Caenorhabditis sp. 36 PRJEB53466]|nr:unnamed protein product [Caenorhabditis sp. 36 PRJEB53466]
MNGETTPSAEGSQRQRKPRPEIQIYRPGALRKGDSTKSLTNEEKPPRPEKLQSTPKSSESRRRQSNDTDSVTSRGGSGSTTPDASAMNERGRNRFGAQTQAGSYQSGGGGQGSSYNSTQSLYDTRRQGGYTEYNGGANRSNHRGGRNQQKQPFERPVNHSRGFNERASMRGDGAIAKRTGGRRRNDSINSTQSEMPPSTNDQLHIDTSYESASQCGASSAFSMNSLGEAFSFEEMCQNLQNFASMDWSKEVENEFAMQQEMEVEEERKKHEENLKNQSPKPKGKLQEANGQTNGSPRKSKNRRNRGRRDESDRESSFGGSIAEENEEAEEELKSGERTPTSVKSTGPAYNPRVLYQRTQRNTSENENNGYSRRPNYQHEPVVKKMEKKGGYRGEHDDRGDDSSEYGGVEQHMTSGRLAGRISIVTRDVPDDPRTRSRAQAQADEISKIIQKRSTSSSEMVNRELLNQRRKEHIEQSEEGAKIREISGKIENLASFVKKRDVKAAEKMIKYSMELSSFYAEVILPDVVYAFTAGLEQRLFRQAFYKSIEALRSGANSVAAEGKFIRSVAQKLLLNGIVFYEQLITRYEQSFEINIENTLTWPQGTPSDEQLIDETVLLPVGIMKFETATQKTAIKSLSRHLTSLGDLHRYKCLIEGSENYEVSKSCYLKAAQLWPSSGHPYNQLGVVVYYSKRVIDEFFYLTRALACSHPYEVARDRLVQRLDAMRSKVSKYQPTIDKECGTVKAESVALGKLQLNRQVWIHPTTGNTENGTRERLVDDILNYFISQPKTKLHRRAVSYLCDTFGMLVTKIGMDHFRSVSERAFGLLFASLSKRETDFSAEQLVQLSAMFIYAVHVNFTKPDSSAQTGIALNSLITFFSVLSRSFIAQKLPLVLPAINVIATWICHVDTEPILKSSDRLETLPSTILTDFDADSTIQQVLATIPADVKMCESTSQAYPETILLASFFKTFDAAPLKTWQAKSGKIEDGRCGMMRRAMEKLRERVKAKEEKKAIETECDNRKEPAEEEEESPRSRKQILDEERGKRTVAMIVHPEYLIPDTNVLIGDLRLVKELLEQAADANFQILVPTIVITELQSLAKRPDARSSSEHDPERREKAQEAVRWLREQERKKPADLKTLTSSGNRVPTFTMAAEQLEDLGKATNDDIILRSALKWSESLPTPPATSVVHSVSVSIANSADASASNTLVRRCVLLTGDRGLTIKANGSQMPTRGVDNFCQWVEGGRR